MSSEIMLLVATSPLLLFRRQHSRHSWSRSQRCWSAAVAMKKKNQIDGSDAKPATSPYNSIIVALRPQLLTSLSLILCRKNLLKLRGRRPVLQLRKLMTVSCLSLSSCARRKAFTLYPWPGSQQEAQLRPCTRLFASGLSWRELVEAILRI